MSSNDNVLHLLLVFTFLFPIGLVESAVDVCWLGQSLKIPLALRPTCILVVTDKADSFDFVPDISTPLVLVGTSDIGDEGLGQSASYCDAILVSIQSHDSLVRFMNRNPLYLERKYTILSHSRHVFEDHFETFSKFLNVVYASFEFGRMQLWKRERQFQKKLIPIDLTQVHMEGMALQNYLFPNILDFDGYEMRASAFTYKPFTILDKNGTNHSGLEFTIANEATKSLNLKLNVKPPADGQLWGYDNPRGSERNNTGLKGDLEFGRADIAWANLFVTSKRLGYMSYTEHHVMERVCMMVPLRKDYPKIFALIQPFDYWTWLGMALTLLTAMLFFLTHCILHDRESSQCSLITNSIGLIIGQSIISTKLQSKFVIRWPITLLALCSFTLTVGYAGSLIAFLTVSLSPKPINTFGELLEEHKTEGLKVTTCCDLFVLALNSSLDPAQRKLAEVLIDFDGREWPSFLNASKGTHATINTEKKMEYAQRLYTLDDDGYSKVHIGRKECILPTGIALGLQRRSPFKLALSDKILRLKEAGLINKWEEDARDSLRPMKEAPSLSNFRALSSKIVDPLSLNEMQGALYIIAVLWLSIILVFTVEIFFRSKFKS